jgi:hypothetical protein
VNTIYTGGGRFSLMMYANEYAPYRNGRGGFNILLVACNYAAKP